METIKLTKEWKMQHQQQSPDHPQKITTILAQILSEATFTPEREES